MNVLTVFLLISSNKQKTPWIKFQQSHGQQRRAPTLIQLRSAKEKKKHRVTFILRRRDIVSTTIRKTNETPGRKIFASLYRRRRVGVSHCAWLSLARHDHVSLRGKMFRPNEKKIGDRPAKFDMRVCGYGPMERSSWNDMTMSPVELFAGCSRPYFVVSVSIPCSQRIMLTITSTRTTTKAKPKHDTMLGSFFQNEKAVKQDQGLCARAWLERSRCTRAVVLFVCSRSSVKTTLLVTMVEL